MQRWNFTLLDTGFFRSGEPFHAGEGGASRVTSCFPPPMSTFQGAIRTLLALSRGWKPGHNKKWPDELGDADHLGMLSIHGPYLQIEKNYLFPAPMHLLIKEDPGLNSKMSTTFLVPGEALVCDLGNKVRLPRKKIELEGANLPENHYLTRAGFTAVAKGEEPSNKDIYKKEKLWLEETRIGLKRNDKTRTAEDHNLYRIGHIRPEYGLNITIIVDGLPSEWPKLLQKVLPLGGEGRLAAVEINPLTLDDYRNLLPDSPQLVPSKDGLLRFTLSLITPCFSENMERLIREGPAGVPGKCISACIGKPGLYGGWDLKKGEPRPLKPFLPSGSTWFFEADIKEKANIESLHGNSISDERAASYGYGQVLIGKWEVD